MRSWSLVFAADPLKNTKKTRDFWHGVLNDYVSMLTSGSQQKSVNRLLAEYRVPVHILPEQEFANGHLYNLKRRDQRPADPYVMHFSWTHDLAQKMQKYHQNRAWYLDPGHAPRRGEPFQPPIVGRRR